MRSAHRHARWALAAAGSVTLALTGLAQTKPAPDAKASSEKATSEKSAVESDISPAVARLAEIKVELAWLGDRATFPCQLAARRVGGKLEVGGFVPDEGLRKKAMDLARANSELPVVDKLLVHPGSAMMIARATHEELSKAAAAVLGRTLAKHAEEFSFETDPSGEITITGLIPTWEDKLTVSRRLSQVAGCTGVVNHFRVRNQMREGQLCNLVSIDGKLRVPAAANAVADNAAPKPAVFTETVQRVEAPNAVPILPTEAPTAVATGPVLPSAGPSLSVAVTAPMPSKPLVTSPVVTSPVATSPVVTAPAFMPSVQSKPIVAAPVVSHPVAPATVILKKEASPFVASNPTPVATTSPNSGLNGAPLKLSRLITLGSNSPAKPTSTVANVVASPALPSKPVASAPVASTNSGSSANRSYVMQLGTPVRNTPPAPSPIQQVSYQEVIPVNPPASKPAPKPTASSSTVSPYGGSPYGGKAYASSPYAASSAPATPSTGNTTGVRSANQSPYGGSPYGAAPGTPAPAPVAQQAPVVRAWAPTPVSQPVQSAPASTPKGVSQPMQVVQASPTSPRLSQPATVTPAMLPGNVATAPVVPTTPTKPIAAPAVVVPVSAQRSTPTPSMAPVTSAEVQGFLASRIQQIGEGKARDIHIQGTASNACVISLSVPSAMDGQQVGQKIINMPELVPYKVDLQIRVQP